MKLIHSVTNKGSSLTMVGNQVVGLVAMNATVVFILISDQTIGANLDISEPIYKDIQM